MEGAALSAPPPPPSGHDGACRFTMLLLRWQGKHPRLCDWVETSIEETLTFYRLPQAHHKHLKSTNLLERLNDVGRPPGSRPRSAQGETGKEPNNPERPIIAFAELDAHNCLELAAPAARRPPAGGVTGARGP